MKSWKVIYRGKDGKPAEERFSAGSREEVFAVIKERGITAIRIEECKGDNSSRQTRSLVRPVAWAIIGLVVAVGAFLAVKFFFKDAEIVSVDNNNKTKRIAEVAPSLTSRYSPTEENLPKPPPKYKTKEERYFAETNGLNKMQIQRWKIAHMPPAGITNNTSQTEEKPYYQIFDHTSENDIAGFLTMEPGETLVGTPSYERWFVKDFLKSLETPIIVTKDDTPEQAALKREMIEVKIDLKARHDAGEDIAAIMTATHEEYQRLAEYKDTIWELLREARREPNATEQDIEDFITAANVQLEAKGIAPIELGPVTRHMLRLRRINKGDQE